MSNNLSTVMFDLGTDLSPIHAAALANTIDSSGMVEKILKGEVSDLEVAEWAKKKMQELQLSPVGVGERTKQNIDHLKQFGDLCAIHEGSFDSQVKSAYASMCDTVLEVTSAAPTAENGNKKKDMTGMAQ